MKTSEKLGASAESGQKPAQPTLKDLLLAPAPRGELVVSKDADAIVRGAGNVFADLATRTPTSGKRSCGWRSRSTT